MRNSKSGNKPHEMNRGSTRASCGDCRAWLVRRIHWMGGIENWDSFGWF